MRSSEQVADLYSALIGAAAKLENPIASARADVQMKQGGRYSYSYAPLDEIATMTRRVLGDFGVAALQEVLGEPGRVGIVTRFIHSSGEWLELGPMWLPAGGTPQEYGSATTYGRRYALTAALLLAAEEDDGGAKAQQRTSSAASGGSSEEAGAAATEPEEADPSPGGRTSDGPSGSVNPQGLIDPSCKHALKKTPAGGLFECSKCKGVGKLAEFKNVEEAVA